MALTEKVATRRDHTDMPGAVDPPSAINDPYITDTGTGPSWAEREHALDYHTDVDVTTTADNDVLQYNSGTGFWESNGLPHSETTGITTDDHHAKSHAHDGADGSGTVAHSDTTGIGTDDHHTKYTDAEATTQAEAAIAAAVLDDLSDVTETTITTGDLIRWNGTAWVNYADSAYSGGAHTHAHADITGQAVDDHHAKYTDAEAVVQADAQIATHTANASAHHAKYTDAEATTQAQDVLTGHNITYDHTSWAPEGVPYLVAHAGPWAGVSAAVYAGAAPGGELGGTWDAPTVDATHSGSAHHTKYTDGEADARIALAVLDDLSDVTETTITTGDLLRWNGTAWVNYADTNYEVGGAVATHAAISTAHHTKYTDAEATTQAEAAIAAAVLDDLSDVTETTITTGDVLRWNGTAWVNYADSAYTGGSTDHGALTGLGDDDHTQYFLADGSRDLTGDLTHTVVSDTLFPLYEAQRADAGPGAVDDNDVLWQLAASGHDGTGYIPGAGIEARIDGTPATNVMPTELVFSTNTGGATATEQWRIAPNGDIEPLVAYLQLGTEADPVGYMASEQISMVGDGWGSSLEFYRKGGANVDDDYIGFVSFYGDDGSGFAQGPGIYARIDGTVAANDMATELVFENNLGAYSNTDIWRFAPTGAFEPMTDSAYDIGKPSVRPATIYSDAIETAALLATTDPTTGDDVGNRDYNDARYAGIAVAPAAKVFMHNTFR